jgi:peptidoglycan/xylan/chitin deacetylase (PgdA/CDA1 family)
VNRVSTSARRSIWRAIRDARRALSSGRTVVLAYHAIADLNDDRVLAGYGVPSAHFERHLDALVSHGWTFIELDALLRGLQGQQRLPWRSILLTFDDGYDDLLSAGVPVLAERGIPGIAFAVADRVGGINEWDREIGADTLRLLDAEGLRALAARGIEIGSHGCSHRRLTEVAREELPRELEGSAAQLEALGLPRPRAFAYPYGAWNDVVARAVRQMRYGVAFTAHPGVVRRNSDRFALPRIVVSASDTPGRVRFKVAVAGWPYRLRNQLLRLLRIQP